MEFFLFYLFSTLALFSALMVIGSRNPVHSVLFLVLAFCNATGLLLLLEVEFMAMIFLVVYVGAIAVLFLFVVMMLSPKVQEEGPLLKSSQSWGYLPVGFFMAVIFLVEVYMVVNGDFIGLEKPRLLSGPSYLSWIQIYDGVGSSTSNLETLGQVLYTYYFYYFLLAGFVLLVAMIGAIVLTLQTREAVSADYGILAKRQQVFEQLSRSSKEAIFTVNRV